MTLAKDEKIGLAIAAVVGAAALATFAYRQTWSTGPAAPVPPPPVEVIDDQAARDDYAQLLEDAFAVDNNAARVTAEGTTLRVKWEMCSKQMLQRLLENDQNFQVKSVREASGLGVKRLRSHGFKQIVCDDGRKGLTPSSRSL